MERPLDKALADELGLTYGAALRELVSGPFLREAARHAAVSLPFFPWSGAEVRAGFLMKWSAYLEALALQTAVRMTPGLGGDERLCRKTFFGTCAFVDASTQKRTKALSPEGKEEIEKLRRRLLRAVEVDRLDEEALARRFFELLHGRQASDAEMEKLKKLTHRTTELLEKLTKTTLEADPKKAKKA